MKELEIDPALAADTLKKMTRTNSEAGTLKGLTSLINNPEFGEGVEDGKSGKFSAPAPGSTEEAGLHKNAVKTFPTRKEEVEHTTPMDPMPRTAPATAAPKPAVSRIVFPNKVFTTGRLKSGKDFFLAAIGAQIHGLADPLYELMRIFFGTDDKTIPGAREFLQAIGQWGRGTISEKYPLTAARATFVTMIRTMGPGGFIPKKLKVTWENYGKDENIWLNALIARLGDLQDTVGPGMRLGISNVRFQNEFDRLKQEGFTQFHVMCSKQSWTARLAKDGKSPNSAAVNDTSEQMAIAFDNQVMKTIKENPKGPKLRVVWSDRQVPAPSERFITLADISEWQGSNIVAA